MGTSQLDRSIYGKWSKPREDDVKTTILEQNHKKDDWYLLETLQMVFISKTNKVKG